MSGETVLVEQRDGIATVTLNRPEARNALNAALVAELERALAALEADPAARVIVLRGAGDKAFCAGADLKGVGDRGTSLQARESFSGLPRILEAMARMRTPLIAQVHGFALAGGCGLAVGCDVVLAADDAVFGLPEIKLGLLPPHRDGAHPSRRRPEARHAHGALGRARVRAGGLRDGPGEPGGGAERPRARGAGAGPPTWPRSRPPRWVSPRRRRQRPRKWNTAPPSAICAS
mgnify:CR=1 FL=1